MLKNQQELYVREGLDWTKIDFYDNQPICDLIDKVRFFTHYIHDFEQKLVLNQNIKFVATTWSLLFNGGA